MESPAGAAGCSALRPTTALLPVVAGGCCWPASLMQATAGYFDPIHAYISIMLTPIRSLERLARGRNALKPVPICVYLQVFGKTMRVLVVNAYASDKKVGRFHEFVAILRINLNVSCESGF